MNKAELIDSIAGRLGDNKKAATEAVEAVIDTITRTVAKGEKVAITGFGIFEKVERAARIARNPATGAQVKVKKTSVPKFRPGTQLKAVVSGAVKLAAPAKAGRRLHRLRRRYARLRSRRLRSRRSSRRRRHPRRRPRLRRRSSRRRRHLRRRLRREEGCRQEGSGQEGSRQAVAKKQTANAYVGPGSVRIPAPVLSACACSLATQRCGCATNADAQGRAQARVVVDVAPQTLDAVVDCHRAERAMPCERPGAERRVQVLRRPRREQRGAVTSTIGDHDHDGRHRGRRCDASGRRQVRPHAARAGRPSAMRHRSRGSIDAAIEIPCSSAALSPARGCIGHNGRAQRRRRAHVSGRHRSRREPI